MVSLSVGSAEVEYRAQYYATAPALLLVNMATQTPVCNIQQREAWRLRPFTFAGVGPLGIVFADVTDLAGENVVAVNSVRPGSAASQHVGLVPGLIVHAVQDRVVTGENFDAVLARIKTAGYARAAAFGMYQCSGEAPDCDISTQGVRTCACARVCVLTSLAGGRFGWCCV